MKLIINASYAIFIKHFANPKQIPYYLEKNQLTKSVN